MIKIKLFSLAAITVIFLLFTTTGCKNKSSSLPGFASASDSAVKEGNAVANAIPDQLLKLLGAYTGSFGDNKITILISEVTNDSVQGRSIVAGNDRPFTGTTNLQNNMYVFKTKEPGTGKHDGSFSFTINTADADILFGSWVPYDTITGSRKTYTLMKKVFKYDPKAGEYAVASERLLKTNDVENLGGWELNLMRNEIFARHGYCFSRKEMRDNFEGQDWYIPYSNDITADLTSIEKENIKLIIKYENYNNDHGDDFGR